ncbi:DNA polymerase epsilon subunit 1 [Colletotrichum truncatum]|uniref:DNA polymerase epsilon subunit 1 n=1 Tax=Colletotrichum truncatum TaxID=5467 RepID=A0ACC3YY44_COLTU|nr:DNA polymerase epsilon subunit 1 [Colletotrichum truncatum]KAF6790803.1 DNA polymerase epsilon subunit 1 [Colletotrichum truncatum]
MSHSRRGAPLNEQRPSKIRKQTHQGPLFATGPVPPGSDAFASLPPCWPPVDDSFVDTQFYSGPVIFGENAWSQSQGISQVDQKFAKSLPAGNQLGLDIFQPASEAPPPALSTVSSVTYSSPSIISQPSSAGSGLSPTRTDMPYDWPAPRSATCSRGPSPTQQTVERAQSRFVCLGPHCDEAFDQEKDLKSHFKAVHTHTCNWADCDQPSFSSKDGLTWHVKLEHLLICPAPGCTESSFQSKRILECHIKWAHPTANEAKANNSQSDAKLMAPTMAASNSSQGSLAGAASAQKDALEDRAIKQILSVAVSKKKCREQLRAVVERRYKKQNGQTPRAADSPSDLSRARCSRLVENASFPLIWEHGVLPFLVEFIPKWCGPNHVVSVTRGKAPGSRRVCIMTKTKPSRARRVIIAAHVRDLLPETQRTAITFAFSTGSVDRLVWARGLGKDMPDEICMARNPYCFKDPCMGDSIGIAGTDDFKESTSTLGPCLIIGGGSYWLANFHPFVDAYQHLGEMSVEHPSPGDRARCLDERHDAMEESADFVLGDLTATSGIDLKTTRISHDPYWEECCKEPPLIVTDWILIAAKTRQANILRRFPSETMPLLKEIPVKATSAVVPGAPVVSTGRTSGQQRGQVCEIPAYVSADENGTGKATREWFIEEPSPYDDEDEWIRGGIGVEGDSGAAVVDAETNALVGQLWGRNKYFGPGPRLTFFTPVGDLFDDIQERCDQQGRPQLPQYRDESDCYPVYPSCRQCYDLRTYLDSRRSSRESLRSMIGRNESDHGDLTSIEGTSELATPKDHLFWSRHTGVEEVGSSFNSIMSPTAPPTFGFAPQPGTPGIVDVKSPYALTLSAEDLYDDEGLTSGAASGKHAAVPLMRSSSQGAKRQRLH